MFWRDALEIRDHHHDGDLRLREIYIWNLNLCCKVVYGFRDDLPPIGILWALAI